MVASSKPAAYRELREPREIKAFSDPLRVRIIHVLLDREATNQQIADELGEPPAKVFHHVRFLVDAGLIRLVETRVSGRNVEKFYRAVARGFILRPDTTPLPESRVAALGAELDQVRHGVLQSAAADADDGPRILRRISNLSPGRLAAFHERLNDLIHEFWEESGEDTTEASRAVLTVLTHREPSRVPGEPRELEDG